MDKSLIDLVEQLQKTIDNHSIAISRLSTKLAMVENSILSLTNQLQQVADSTVNDQQLVTTQQSQSMILAATNAVYNKVRDEFYNEINQKVMPEVKKTMDRVNYHMQNGDEVVDGYRRAVNDVANDKKLLTFGGDTRHIISEHVSLFFNADDM